MSTQSKPFSFKGQKIFVGLDVHLRSWSVTILSEQAVLKKFTQDPSPVALNKFLTNTYPDAEYNSVARVRDQVWEEDIGLAHRAIRRPP